MIKGLITPDEQRLAKVEHLAGLFRQGLLKARPDSEILKNALENGGDLQKDLIAAVYRRGKKVRTATLTELLRECQGLGIPLCNGNPKAAIVGDKNPRAKFQILTYDIGQVFERRKGQRLPWGGDIEQQARWAGSAGVATSHQVIQAIIHYYTDHGTMPGDGQYWWMRCSDMHDQLETYKVQWGSRGLSVSHCYRMVSDGGACLPVEMPIDHFAGCNLTHAYR